jgi:4-hydroxybutyrate CoA-transferase
VERRIAEHILPLIPKAATIQIGIGNIPEALLECLPRGLELNIAGMAVDYMKDLVENGVVTGDFRSIELMSTKKLFEFCHDNPRVQMQSSTEGHNPLFLKNIPRFVSINSAVEVDFAGQVNSESIGSRQLSSVGGQYDFVEAAHWSEGGFPVFAFASTSGPEGKYSRIVPRLSHGARVTTPRYMVRYVVTEYGVADLWGKTVIERAEALIRIAHPKFQPELEEEFKKMFG